jgi:hypothetical protein
MRHIKVFLSKHRSALIALGAPVLCLLGLHYFFRSATPAPAELSASSRKKIEQSLLQLPGVQSVNITSNKASLGIPSSVDSDRHTRILWAAANRFSALSKEAGMKSEVQVVLTIDGATASGLHYIDQDSYSFVWENERPPKSRGEMQR